MLIIYATSCGIEVICEPYLQIWKVAFSSVMVNLINRTKQHAFKQHAFKQPSSCALTGQRTCEVTWKNRLMQLHVNCRGAELWLSSILVLPNSGLAVLVVPNSGLAVLVVPNSTRAKLIKFGAIEFNTAYQASAFGEISVFPYGISSSKTLHKPGIVQNWSILPDLIPDLQTRQFPKWKNKYYHKRAALKI